MRKGHIKLVFVAFLFIGLTVLNACKQKFNPKPRAYFRIDFPEKSYQQSNLSLYPYRFEYPNYAKLIADTSFMAEPYWLNIEIAKHKAKLHISYKAIDNNLHLLTDESHELAYKHAIKAISINEKIFVNAPQNVWGTIYEIKGNTASPLQFHLTDSTNHFIRGSFYISEIPNYDSLQPVINFIESDILHFIETLNWE
ncbi:MAG TPA: gliding motility lipoprotein GldD [Prolixibacteraceae bacterium]|nr:gliding motility lipoprotein GldD [Prolixibacteraceae bacterium]HPR61389.1 gliding motility lipoprotein GldD [Prolixibacteraceae bacterium]